MFSRFNIISKKVVCVIFGNVENAFIRIIRDDWHFLKKNIYK